MSFAVIASAAGQQTTSAIDTTGANLIVLSTGEGSGTNCTVSDNKSNTWTLFTEFENSPDDAGARIFYCYAPTVGSDHTFSCSVAYASICALAVSGAASTPADLENETGTNGSSSSTTGAITPSADNALVIAAWGTGVIANTYSVSSPFSLQQSIDAATGVRYGGAMASSIQTTASAASPTLSWTGTATSASVIASFKAAASGGGASAELAGSAISTATATASLTTQIPLTGAATSVATASGSLTSSITLAGASASVAVANGELITQIRLSGAALAQVLANGALTTEIRLSGTALMQALAAADLTTSPSGLAASATATATASGDISTGIFLLAEASCIAIAEGGLTTAIQLTGSAVSVSTATGDLTVTSGFTASALTQVTATGTLSTQIRLDAAAVMHAIAAASLTTGAQLVAFYDELDAFYGEFSVQCSANGLSFNGILDTTDVDQFGALSMSTHRLRYPAVGSAVAAQGDVMVAGVRYKVIEIPRRISRSEMVAELVKQP